MPTTAPNPKQSPPDAKSDAVVEVLAPKIGTSGGFKAIIDGPAIISARDTWFIWQKYGHPPHFAHPTEELAMAEATRLAKRHPGKSFIVMRAKNKVRVELSDSQAPTPQTDAAA